MEKKLVLQFPSSLVDKPIISSLVRDFSLDFNILRAQVTPKEGNLVLELTGAEEHLDQAVKHLKRIGVKVKSLSKEIEMVKERCTACSACVPLCPVEALTIEGPDRTVVFDSGKCIACGICIKACPVNAMVLKV